MLDVTSYVDLVGHLRDQPACLERPPSAASRLAAAGYWAAGKLSSVRARVPDSTALAHFVSRSWPTAIRILGLLVIAAAVYHAHARAWSTSALLGYLWVAHAAVLVSGPIFHNNYLVWLLPLIGMTLIVPFGCLSHPNR